jgi:hypothetical protein
LNNECILKINEGQECKTGPVRELVLVGGERMNREGEGE